MAMKYNHSGFRNRSAVGSAIRLRLCILLLGLVSAGLSCKESTPPPAGAAEKAAEKAKPPDAPEKRPPKRRIAVIPKGTTHEFWKAVHAGAVKAGRKRGVEILWKGPVREDDRDEQIKVVENFIAGKVDGMVLAPLDDTALVRPAADAVKQGIPVVIIDSGIKWSDRVSFVATDNFAAGAHGAARLGEILEGKGRVILLRYQEGSASTKNREEGFLDLLARRVPGIEVVSSNQYGGATTESAYQTAENLLIKYPGIDGIFCPNESTTFGMLRALQDAGKAGKVKFVGFDSSPKLVEALRNGHLHGLVLQHPFRMGELAVRAGVDALDGKEVPVRIDTGVNVATAENMEELEHLLEPDLDRWLD
jgi:ribose transport system substrate-binding protein